MAVIMELAPLGAEELPAAKALGRVAACDVQAVSSCPSVDSSLKDGLAVISGDVESASPENPVTLRVIGSLTAGDTGEGLTVTPGTAVRIMTGSHVPPGADAVLASEFSRQRSDHLVEALADAEAGRNILRKGSDIQEGELVIARGRLLTPACLGLLAAAGVGSVQVYRPPKVAVAATGSELVAPGEKIGPGQVAASNMVTISAELERIGIKAKCVIFKDDLAALRGRFSRLLEDFDVVLTCGGVLDGDKDYTVRAMEELGVEMLFRRVRMGPGKGICMGRHGDRYIFNLPGGPPSNHVAALVLAIPGIRRLMGFSDPFPPRIEALADRQYRGQRDWTQFSYAGLESRGGMFHVKQPEGRSRLMRMASAEGLAELPEGSGHIGPGDFIRVWLTGGGVSW